VRQALGASLVAVYWFGSRARGQGSDESDYDFLIETAHHLSEEERDRVADVAVDLSADHGVLLDIHQRTSETLRRRRPFSLFAHTVLLEGVQV
jgi:predicted nucleotidyltransferase